MTSNIVGEPFDEFVKNQINVRQSNQYSGYETLSRTNSQLQYLTNRNAWAKIASSIFISENKGLEKLKNINIQSPENFLGTQLAEKAILFNTLSSFNPTKKEYSPLRAGISNNANLWNNQFIYGIGGTDFGIQPPPGITGVQVDSLNRGSIRKANITLKAHNKFQFDIIELLYLRLGSTMMLEWGWDKYLDSITGEIKQVGNTLIEEEWFTVDGITQREMLNKIQTKRRDYDGNYDGFFGKVSNFTWSFNPDGSYDISIDLITLGDVIESLKVNTVPKTEFGEVLGFNPSSNSEPKGGIAKDSKILEVSNLNVIGYFLYDKVKNFKNNNINYIKINPKSSSNSNSQYYIKLDEFLSQLENLTFPQITNNNGKNYFSPLKFEKFGCKISYFPNQIPLDPRVCIFKPLLNSYGDIKGIDIPPYLNSKTLADYAFSNENDSYGLLMNIYINFEFISELLLSNGGPDQTLPLFKFLQDLCNGVNNSLGGVNKLEPIIKDDNIITIIDQTYQPPEIQEDQPLLKVFGYSNSDQTSNFVKDIKFISKITPQLASMISIGATAAGSSTSEIDGTAFSKWSEGLNDRFALETREPKPILINFEELNEEKIQKYKKIFEGFDYADEIKIKRKSRESEFSSLLRTLKQSFEDNDKRLRKISRVPYYEELAGEEMTLQEFARKAYDIDKRNFEKGEYKPEEINQLVGENYDLYLINAFGGNSTKYKTIETTTSSILSGTGASSISRTQSTTKKPLSIDKNNSRYLEFNDTFISQGKAAYKNYINILNNSRYVEKNIPSNEIGFIPLSFDLILDGISGIKIYNKLNIDTRFLPSNYPESLNFIITKVNHNISNNNWETSLSTISVPKTQPYKFESFPTQINENGELNITGPQPDNGTPLIITKKSNRQARLTIDNVLSELNPIARPAFRKFFETLQKDYSGYKVIINEIQRTWEESWDLKYNPLNPSFSSKNAEPGKSLHNYGFALDINIETPASTSKRTLLKSDKRPWIEEGIDKVARNAGLRWGGDFLNYIDCVHFDVYYNLNTAYTKTLEQAKILDPTISSPPFVGPQGKISVQKIDKLIKEGKIKL